MTRLYIPACGDRLKLTSSWTFTLYFEHRNFGFAKEQKVVLEDAPGFSRWGQPRGWEAYTIPVGTVLECDRVYIRTFNKSASSVEDDYDSITWKIIGENGKQKKNCRFWAKLSECNNIEFEIPQDANYKERAKTEAAVEATKPKKLDVDEIRTMISRARSYDRQSTRWKLLVDAEQIAMSHFVDSQQRQYETYQEYSSSFERERRSCYNEELLSFFRKVSYVQLTQEKFLHEFFGKNYGSLPCKFSKRSDGTCCRKFSHPVVSSGVGRRSYYNNFDFSSAMSGLFYSVITDANDQEIIAIEICKERIKEK